MSDESKQVGQDEIEDLLKQAQASSAKTPASPQAPGANSSNVVEQDEIEQLLKGAVPGAKSAKSEAKAAAADDSTKILAQSDIEALLNKSAPQVQTAKPPPVEPPPSHVMGGSMAGRLLHQAERALASIDQPPAVRPRRAALRVAFSRPPSSGRPLSIDSRRRVDLKIGVRT
jgi:hypothetical protein